MLRVTRKSYVVSWSLLVFSNKIHHFRHIACQYVLRLILPPGMQRAFQWFTDVNMYFHSEKWNVATGWRQHDNIQLASNYSEVVLRSGIMLLLTLLWLSDYYLKLHEYVLSILKWIIFLHHRVAWHKHQSATSQHYIVRGSFYFPCDHWDTESLDTQNLSPLVRYLHLSTVC